VKERQEPVRQAMQASRPVRKQVFRQVTHLTACASGAHQV
jgi:hypothetical protein